MKQQEAIRAEHAAMDELARIGQELDALDMLIFHFGQARYYNADLLARLTRARARIITDRERWQARRAEAARHITKAR